MRRGGVHAAAERQRERLDHSLRDLVLQLEQVAERHLYGVRRDERSARGLDELRRGPQLVAGAHQGAHHHAVHLGFDRERLQVRGLTREARGGGARAHHQRADARERGGDGVGQAEGQEVRLGIRPQDAERQHHEARESAGEGRSVVAFHAAHSAQLLRQGLGRGRALGGPLGEGLADHATDADDGGRPGERGRLLVERRVQDLDGVLAQEGRPARQHLEQDGAHREQIAPGVEAVAGHLLRSHVARGAEHHAGVREPAFGRGRAGHVGIAGIAGSREAEVEQLHAVGREEDVRRLQVAVHDPARVERLERGQHRERDRHRLRHAQRPALQPLAERLAFEQLHRDEELPLVLADVVELADVRVVDARRGPGLALEALARGLVSAQRAHRLERDGAVEPLVARGVDDPHAALAELAGHLVVRDPRGHRRRRCHR